MDNHKFPEHDRPRQLGLFIAVLVLCWAALAQRSQAAPNLTATPTPAFSAYLPLALRNRLAQPTPAASLTSTPMPTWTSTAIPSASPTRTVTVTSTASHTATPSATTTTTVTATHTLTASPSQTVTRTATATATATMSATLTCTNTPTYTGTPRATLTWTPTATASATSTNSPTLTSTVTSSVTKTPSATATPSPTQTPSQTPSPTGTHTSTATKATTPTNTATFSPTASHTATHIRTATATPTNTPSHTATATPTETLAPTLGIYGWVTNRGEPAAGITVTLGVYENAEYQWKMAETRTDEYGIYIFYDMPSLSVGESYGVRYENVLGLSGRLAFWYCYTFSDYSAGESYPGGDFDIADVALLAPNSTVPQPWPVTFRWTARSSLWAPDDVYQVDIGTAYYSDYLLGSGSLTLPSLPDVLYANSEYEWTVWIFGGTGYGRALNKYTVVFSP